MFTSSHQSLIYHLRGVVLTGVNVYTFLHDRVGARSEGLSGLVPAWLDFGFLARLGLGGHSGGAVVPEIRFRERVRLRIYCVRFCVKVTGQIQGIDGATSATM